MEPVSPYGLWPSPLRPEDIAKTKRLRDMAWDSDGKTLVWLEGRGDQGILVCQRQGQAPRDLDPTLSVRARIGYGGGDFTVAASHAYFVENSGRLFVQTLDAGLARELTPSFGHAAAPTASRDTRLLVYVHTENGIDRLAIVDTAGIHWPQRLVEGSDFYMQPTWHPGGRQLAWIEWDHPQMPWDGSRLCLGDLKRSRHGLPHLSSTQTLAGDTNISVQQPQFSPDGRLLAYLSDQSGHSELYIYNLQEQTHLQLTNQGFDIATPAWSQGLRHYGFSADGHRLYFARSEGGNRRAWFFDLPAHSVNLVEGLRDYTHVEQLTPAPRGRGVAAVVSAPAIPPRLVCCNLNRSTVIARSNNEHVSCDELADPSHISWLSASGEAIHGLYYPPPAHPSGLRENPPPLVITVHGGPTGQSTSAYDSRNQFLATRGWGVLDVNYRGSSGYGRQYLQALRGQWGICDVEDVFSGARTIVERGWANEDKLVIMGGSAGGYTVLRALATQPGFFRAGICLYGISNLFTLVADTHKFESRYLEGLIGALPGATAIYHERSPIFAADDLTDPVAIFQGSEDQVVPPDQTRSIVESLRRRQVPHEYHVYEGEGHGWRRPETISAFYLALDNFLRQYILFA